MQSSTGRDEADHWAGGEPVGSEEVRQLAVASADRPPWDLTDAWGDHDVATALEVVEEKLDRNAIPRRAQAAMLAGSLAAHLTRLRQLAGLAREGVRAKDAAGGRDVRIGGGVATVREYLQARLIDELHLAMRPVFMGRGENLFAGLDMQALGYECYQHIAGERATHLLLRRLVRS